VKIIYRPEIDGLRAIAVVSVILYHAQIAILGFKTFSGGFIGVDIFFVISGYLITSIILKELILTKTLSFKHFYERRIRRIFPLLLLVMLTSLPLAWMYLMPTSFVDFSKSLLYSLGFSSNFYFYYSGLIYGGENGILKPFLHTWSLSIEEQFYIIFPIILFIIFKYFRKYLLTILVIVFIQSLVLSDWGSKNYPSLTFYVLPSRIWELLAGSILAYFEIELKKTGERVGRDGKIIAKITMLNLTLPALGFFLIVNSIFLFNDKMFHPSFYTLQPIIGVCLIIWFSHKDELITKILSSKLFVKIGLISYSLYLWHYPIFVFARITEFAKDNNFKSLLLGIIILLLSIMSFYFIERPARNKKNQFTFIFFFVLVISFILIFINSIIISKYGYKNRLPEIIEENFNKEPWLLLKDSDGKSCHNNNELCKFNSSSNKKIYIIGDSQAATLAFDLKEKIISKDYQFITSTRDGCIYFPGFTAINVEKNIENLICNKNYFLKLKSILSKVNNSIIIISGNFPAALNKTNFDNEEGGISYNGKINGTQFISVDAKYNTIQDSFRTSVLELSKNNKVILVYSIPEVGWHVPNKIFNSIPKKISLIKDYLIPENFITTSFQIFKKRNELSFELLDSINGDNIFRVYPHILFCDNIIKNRCLTHDDKDIYYTDDHHPSIKGSKMINDLIIKEIKNIELKSN